MKSTGYVFIRRTECFVYCYLTIQPLTNGVKRKHRSQITNRIGSVTISQIIDSQRKLETLDTPLAQPRFLTGVSFSNLPIVKPRNENNLPLQLLKLLCIFPPTTSRKLSNIICITAHMHCILIPALMKIHPWFGGSRTQKTLSGYATGTHEYLQYR